MYRYMYTHLDIFFYILILFLCHIHTWYCKQDNISNFKNGEKNTCNRHDASAQHFFIGGHQSTFLLIFL